MAGATRALRGRRRGCYGKDLRAGCHSQWPPRLGAGTYGVAMNHFRLAQPPKTMAISRVAPAERHRRGWCCRASACRSDIASRQVVTPRSVAPSRGAVPDRLGPQEEAPLGDDHLTGLEARQDRVAVRDRRAQLDRALNEPALVVLRRQVHDVPVSEGLDRGARHHDRPAAAPAW